MKNRTLLFIIILVLIFSFTISKAQTDPVELTNVENQLENNSTGSDDQTDLSELTEQMEFLLNHPLNLNTCNESDLATTGLFTPMQTKAILRHRELFGAFLTREELQTVEGFDLVTIRKLFPFITCGRNLDDPNASFKRMIDDGQHQVIVRLQEVIETKKGFEQQSYLGSPVAIYARYRFAYMRKLSFGLTMEKDAGEDFFDGAQKNGFDFYSFHFYKKQTKFLNVIAIGDYQLEYGQGLTLCTGLSGGKPLDPMAIRKNMLGIKPYTSVNEVFFKRGAAVSLRYRKWNTDLFVSRRRLDANLSSSADTLTQSDIFTSFQESGYHRTWSEVQDKGGISEWFYGMHTGYSNNTFQSGVTVVHSEFNIPLQRNVQPYNRFDFNSNKLTNAGWDYSFLWKNFNFFGEMSIADNLSKAMVHGFLAAIDPGFSISMLYRKYDRNYQSLYSGSFRESSNSINEEGYFIGASFRPVRTWVLNVGYDYFRFPWLKYRTDAPSFGNEITCLLTYTPSRKTELYFRYKSSNKLLNTSNDDALVDYLVPIKQQAIRFNVSTKISPVFTLKTRVEQIYFSNDIKHETGFLIFQDVQYHPMGSPWSWNLRYALFETNSYDSRLYAYENDVLGAYAILPYYYKGSRFYFNSRFRLTKSTDLWLRYSLTSYANREVIGSGLDEIKGNKKSEIKLQFRIEF